MLDIVATIALAYGLLLLAVFVLQRRLQYFPDRSTPHPAAAGVPEMSAVRLTTEDGLEVTSWHHLPDGAPALVYFHGNAGHAIGRAAKVRPYLDAGYGVLLVGYRAYGGNPGRPSEAGLYADGRAALAYLDARGVAPERTVLYGESLGSGVAVRMASERQVGALVLEAPFTSAADVGAAAYPFLPVRFLMRDRYDSLSRIGDLRAPLLILHGERDRTVPVHHGKTLLAAARDPKEGCFFAEAGHADLYEFGAGRVVLEFLDRHGVAPRKLRGHLT